MQMDYKYIEQLLDKYFDATSSESEEKILKIFFSQKEIPAHLAPFADIFRLTEAELVTTPGKDFEERLMQRIGIQEETAPKHVKAQRMTLSQRLHPLGRAAAAVAIVALVGGSMYRAYMTNIIEPIERAEYATAAENGNDGTNIDTTPLTPAQLTEDSRKMAINIDTLAQVQDKE